MDGAFLHKLKLQDRLELEDCRGGARAITVTERHGHSWLAHGRQHIYLREGAACVRRRSEGKLVHCEVGPLPEVVEPLLLHVGQPLLLVPDDQEGAPAEEDRPARIPCTLEAVFHAARPGQAVWFDDGRIGARVAENRGEEIELEITHAAPKGSRLRPEKGVNLPDTDLDTPALTAKDLADLEAMAPLADIVGLSFVRNPADVETLHAELDRLHADHLGTVLKIETRQGFENLGGILLAALGRPPTGVMVARGDLAVEVGFERLAEVQEEILWLCEAAQVPAIWATQVLDTMARRGLPSRAEVSDAALAVRAEAVMLNKGPYIVETTRFLAGILDRMRSHQVKSRPVMRKLAVSRLKAQ
jgi:pyruvate kinase